MDALNLKIKSSDLYREYIEKRDVLYDIYRALKSEDFGDVPDQLEEALEETAHFIRNFGLYIKIPSYKRLDVPHKFLREVFDDELGFGEPQWYSKKYQAFTKTKISLKPPTEPSSELSDFDFSLSYGFLSDFGLSEKFLNRIKKSKIFRSHYGNAFLDPLFEIKEIEAASDLWPHGSYIFFGSCGVSIRQFFDVDCSYEIFDITIKRNPDEPIDVSNWS